MGLSLRSFCEDLTGQGLIGRQSNSEVMVGTTVLPIGAVIGIAIAGSAILFGVLTLTMMYYLRSRYKSENQSRDLDLSDDNEENILDALRSTHPSDRESTTKISNRISDVGSECIPTERIQIPPRCHETENSKSILSEHTFEITGLRDSWPLVGWVESPPTVSLPANKHPAINLGNTDRRISYSAFPVLTNNDQLWPQSSFQGSGAYTRGLDNKPIQWSRHSAKSSISSLKRLPSNRKSVSDNQLASILRSTSQRLREAQRQPLSRSLSVMSQMSGAPPTVQPPSPPEDHREKSGKEVVDDDMSLIDSVRSSVLDSVSHSPSPRKITSERADNIEQRQKNTSPITLEISDSESLSPSRTPDLFSSSALSLTNKLGARSDQKYKMSISSTTGYLTKTCKAERHPSLTKDDGALKVAIPTSYEADCVNDPFTYIDPASQPTRGSNSIKGPRPLVKRQAMAGQIQDQKEHETPYSPLHTVSGNQKSPTLSTPASTDLSEVVKENPFQWSPDVKPSLLLPPSQKPIGVKPKGHRRHKTIRLSHASRSASVAVVPEEPENGSLPQLEKSIELQNSYLIMPAEPVSTSMDSNHSNTSSVRPPSTPTFQPFLHLPPMASVPTNSRTSDIPYSPTMSFYDYYSSNGASPSDHFGISERSQSPTPSTKKSRPRGGNFSVDVTRARGTIPFKVATSSFHPDRSMSLRNRDSAQVSKVDISSGQTVGPAFISPCYGATTSSHVSNESLAASVSLLRRMNSEVSTYSTGSFLSDHSDGSPTIPALRGGGLSPTKRGNDGAVNYLNIRVTKPNLTTHIEGTHFSTALGKSRNCNDSLNLEDGLENHDALGLIMPILEDSPSKMPLLKSRSGLGDWPAKSLERSFQPHNAKPPAAQLRTVGNTPLLQENCLSCNKPLSPLRLNPRDSTLASWYHDHCFKCSTCKEHLGTAFAIDKKPYCKKHYYERVNEICNIHNSPDGEMSQDPVNGRLLEYITTPLKKGIRHPSQMEVPSPHTGSPQSVIKSRGSLGLYDDMGFLKSSPDRGKDAGLFDLGSADDLVMGA